MTKVSKQHAGNLIYAIKLLTKNFIFWINLIAAISITTDFILLKHDVVAYIVSVIGLLNWFVVIAMFIKAIKH